MIRLARLSWLFPSLIFGLHALAFKDWINDDAGISFAYARNLAAGHGLVAQPHTPPLEGYSNFLWVVVMAACFALKLFHRVWTPKLVALVLTTGSFYLVGRTLNRAAPWGGWVALPALSLVALQPGFVIWSISGLENPLTVFLACALMAAGTRVLAPDPLTLKSGLSMALIASALAMTRPDAVLYTCAFPLLLAGRFLSTREKPSRSWLGPAAGYGALLSVLLGGFLLFRWRYFHDLFPNTYYAKGGPTFQSAVSILLLRSGPLARLVRLFESMAGVAGAGLLGTAVVALLFIAITRRIHAIHCLLGIFAGISTLVYLLLPEDWMPEYRFATPFFVFAYCLIMALVHSLAEALPAKEESRRLAFNLLAVMLLAGTIWIAAGRTPRFARNPTVPLATIAEFFGDEYNRIARLLGVESGSLLVPDVGGALLYSNLRVFDLGMLCDRTIARTLGKNQQAFYDYVFEEVRPTFIHTHDYWSSQADLDRDARFRRDYLPLHEYLDETVLQESGVRIYSGDYVRKGSVAGREPQVRLAQDELLNFYRLHRSGAALPWIQGEAP